LGKKKSSSPFSNTKWKWGLQFGLGFFIHNVLHYTLLNPIMWNISSITTNLLSRIGVDLRFTINNKSTHDNVFFHFTFLLICYNIHLLLVINGHLSLKFKFILGTCHPTTKALKSLNNNQSNKKKKKTWISPTVVIATIIKELQAP
jgi:hypothetical protein